MDNPSDVISFWRNAGRRAWFTRGEAFDDLVRNRFEPLHHAAARGELEKWMACPEGSLALLLLLDQFPRNIWRNSAHAFATDSLARMIARHAISAGHDQSTDLELRAFFYLPFEHSEEAADQDLAVNFYDALERDGGEGARWAHHHRDIIRRFGRFPHRNACLGRQTTEEEQRYLDDGGFRG